MGKFIFNDIFKEIVDTYYIDSTALGNMTDRDSSRIRHYKTDSKPSKASLEQLITAICSVISETNDSYTNLVLMDKLNQIARNSSLFSFELKIKLKETSNINEYVSFILRRSLELSNEALKENDNPEQLLSDDQGIITRVSQGHNYFQNNLYDEAIDLFQELLQNSYLSLLPEQHQLVHTDLGLIYRSYGLNKYDPELLNQAVHHLEQASKIALEKGDIIGNAIINKYTGTVYTSLSYFENAELNLKKSISHYDLALAALAGKDQEEYSRVMINYGTLFVHYSNIRSTRYFLKNAITYFEKAIEYYKDTNNYFKAVAYLNCSGAYSALADVCNTQENAKNAILMVQKALEIYTIEDYPLYYAQCISNLGHIHLMMAVYNDTIENCNKAIGYIHHALSIFSENIDKYSYWIAQLNLTIIYLLLSNATKDYSYLDKAMQCIEECKKHNVAQDNSINKMKSNLNHAEVLIHLAEAKKDISFLSEAEEIILSLLAVAKKVKYEYIIAFCEYLLARLSMTSYVIAPDPDKLKVVLEHTEYALDIFMLNTFPLNYGLVVQLVAEVYRYQGEYKKSRLEYEGLLNIFTKEKYSEKHKILFEDYQEVCRLIDMQ